MRFVIIQLIALIPFFSFAQSKSQKEDVNVLSYYAVTNSIDGQPFIDQRNLLRFYPVFALRDSVLAVKITIYYGNEIFIDNAVERNDGLYWEVKLPDFDLGDAIQRYEVETKISYSTNVKQEIVNYKKNLLAKQTDAEKKWASVQTGLNSFSALNSQLSGCFNELNTAMKTNNSHLLELLENMRAASELSKIPRKLERLLAISYKRIDSLVNTIKNETGSMNFCEDLVNLSVQIDELSILYSTWQQPLFSLTQSAGRAFEKDSIIQLQYKKVIEEIDQMKSAINLFSPKFNSIGEEQKAVARYIVAQEHIIDTLKRSLITKLTDKSFTGISIEKSDIVFENDSIARILYRNYRDENRHLVVLDPAEKLSIFKVRYIPFPVVGSTLAGPNYEGIPIVFEVGLTFGNQVITSNDFYKPSIERLGVSIALTPKLFSKQAQILGLLFTYDFNTYASIGFGANFGTGVANDQTNPPRKLEPYFSFGINQKAFQRLVTGIGNIFR